MSNQILPFVARDILTDCDIPLGTDFFVTGTDARNRLLHHAKELGYRAPKHANGSTARYFHDYLQRRASRKES